MVTEPAGIPASVRLIAPGLWAALGLLTRLPVPSVGAHVRSNGTAGLVWFPVAGAVLGAILVIAHTILAPFLSPMVTAAVMVVLLILLSGALHVDGLADAFDALWAPVAPVRRLEIMRDPHIGTFGVVAVVSILLLKVAGLTVVDAGARGIFLILAPVLGRWAIVLVATLFAYGRTQGLGAPVKADARPSTLAVASLVPAVLVAVSGPAAALAAMAAVIAALLVARWMMTLLPGLTGDCYGAVCEIVETMVWIVAAPLLGWLV